MHNREQFPEIFAAMEKLQAELEPILAERKKDMDAMNAVEDEITVLRGKKAKLHDKACVNLPQIKEKRGQISRLANAMGAVKV